MVDKVKGGVKRGCVHFDTPSLSFIAVIIVHTSVYKDSIDNYQYYLLEQKLY